MDSLNNAIPSSEELLTNFLANRLKLLCDVKNAIYHDEKETFEYLISQLNRNEIVIRNNGGESLHLNFDNNYLVENHILNPQILDLIKHLRARITDKSSIDNLNKIVEKIEEEEFPIKEPIDE